MKIYILFILIISSLYADGCTEEKLTGCTDKEDIYKNIDLKNELIIDFLTKLTKEQQLILETSNNSQIKNIVNQEEFIKDLVKQNAINLQNTISDNIYVLEIFVAFLVFFTSILIVFLEYKHNKHIDNKINANKELLSSYIENLKKEQQLFENNFNTSLQEVVNEKISNLFKSKYDQIIYNQVETLTSSSLLKEKEILNLNEVIIRKMSIEIYKELKEEIEENRARSIVEIINTTFLKQKAIKLISSSKDADIREGLNLIKSNINFTEIKPYLETLKKSYKNEPSRYELILLIDEILHD